MKSLNILALAASLTGISSAASIVQTGSYAFVPNGSQTLTFNKFDTTLGTLTSVTVSVTLTKTGGTYEVDNDSATGGTIDLTHSVIGQLSSPDVSLRKTGAGVVFVGQTGSITAVNSLTNQSVSATTGDSTTSFNATGLGDYVFFAPADSSSSDSGTIRAADNADYEFVGLSTFNKPLPCRIFRAMSRSLTFTPFPSHPPRSWAESAAWRSFAAAAIDRPGSDKLIP